MRCDLTRPVPTRPKMIQKLKPPAPPDPMRRRCAALALLALPVLHARATPAGGAPGNDIAARLRELERGSGGWLGVAILDTATGARFGHRADERFLMCSTFKLLASALVLHRVDQDRESLDRRIVFRAQDLPAYAPITERHAGGAGMTLAELCDAAITYSDNGAANLILASYGGPAAFTAYARGLGDTTTRLDHDEPALNRWHGQADTTSPGAMLETLQRVVLGDALRPDSRERLQRWMLANTTGARRLKAGLPADWRIGDKTGSAGNRADANTSNDIGVVWPPGDRAPLIVTAFLTRSRAPDAARDATLAQVGALLPRIVAARPGH